MTTIQPRCSIRTLDPGVDFLAELPGRGGARVRNRDRPGGAPARERGVSVHGIELSSAMVAKLGEKPEARRSTSRSATSRRARGGLVHPRLLVYNTIGNLTTQDAQVACFRNAAAHLEPGGCFDRDPRPRPPAASTRRHLPGLRRGRGVLGDRRIRRGDAGLISHHVHIEEGRVEVSSFPFRYAWPAEFDLMAQIAGMSLRERWGGWKREPFTGESEKHVLVWEKPAI